MAFVMAIRCGGTHEPLTAVVADHQRRLREREMPVSVRVASNRNLNVVRRRRLKLDREDQPAVLRRTYRKRDVRRKLSVRKLRPRQRGDVNVWKDANVRNAAYGLARKPEVSARVSELRDRAAGADCASKHDILVALSSAIAAAAADGVLAANARLVDIYCRMRGFYEPERVDARVGCLDPSDRDRKIASLIGGG